MSQKVPSPIWFGISAVFHYLGPSFAVLLFPSIGVLGIAWFRVTSAALVFAPFTRPWSYIREANRQKRLLIFMLGFCLAIMNVAFYLALDRLPMNLVAAMEFVGTIGVALYGVHTFRNVVALVLAVCGVVLMIDVKWVSDPAGLLWALLNASLFVGYILLGHKAAQSGASEGIRLLGASMAIAGIALLPIGFIEAMQVFGSLPLVLAGIAVGLCSSVIPYLCDQLAMARLPRASFALMLALLPAMATIIGALVLSQIPSPQDLIGIVLVMVGIAVHQPA
ncbi:MAG: EamA family transporter [Sneathiellales bacterium]|nr:EamA family transporter [Sneathiellales bacterium]